jgi:hypothetical protein
VTGASDGYCYAVVTIKQEEAEREEAKGGDAQTREADIASTDGADHASEPAP